MLELGDFPLVVAADGQEGGQSAERTAAERLSETIHFGERGAELGGVEFGVAGRFPLNDTAREEIDPGIIFIVDLFIDDIFPWTRWQPFGGSS